MSEVRIGTVDLPQQGGWEGYFRRLNYLELSGMHATPVKAGTIARWAEVAPGGSFGLLAPWVITQRDAPRSAAGTWPKDAGSGDFRDSPAARTALTTLAEVAGKVSAHAVLFAAAPMFSPSATNREVLRRFFTEIATAEMFGTARRVLIPSGLWPTRTAVTLAGELGILAAIDPLLEDPDFPMDELAALPTESVYLRPLSMGRAGALSADRLDTLAAIAEAYADVTVAFATPNRFRDAQGLKAALEST